MTRTYKAGVIGCGDYLKIMSSGLKASKLVRFTHFYDVNQHRASDFARDFSGQTVPKVDEMLAMPEIAMVVMFVPPWVRSDLVCKAAAAGKHILTTKPLAPNTAECMKMVRTARQHKVKVGVIYNRTSNSVVETMKCLFQKGSIGKLALYRQDWIHHYPQWNNWALDPEKNGGPFMDAMIHNLNIARYLMGRSATVGTMFSDHHSHPELTCADTETLKLDFEECGSAHLFITWAADLAVYSTKGNQREHIDWCYGVTDQGWRITQTKKEGVPVIEASRLGKQKYYPLIKQTQTIYDRFVKACEGGPWPADLPDLTEAMQDIDIIRRTLSKTGRPVLFNSRL